MISLLHCSSRIMVDADSTNDLPIQPARALELATPYLELIFQLRCLRREDKSWCSRPARNYITLEGSWYCVLRESYPYKTLNAYQDPCVRVHTKTGRIALPSLPDL